MFSFASFTRAFPHIHRYLQRVPAGPEAAARFPAATGPSAPFAAATTPGTAPAALSGREIPGANQHCRLNRSQRRSHREDRPLTYSGGLRHVAG